MLIIQLSINKLFNCQERKITYTTRNFFLSEFIIYSIINNQISRLVGSLYGRILGVIMRLLFGRNGLENNLNFQWMDPGVIATLGAASFFAGVSRSTIALTVIMVRRNSLFVLI